MTDYRKEPTSQVAWGWYNCGRLIGIERTRRVAIKAVEANCMEPWSKAKHYMEVHRVRVERYAP